MIRSIRCALILATACLGALVPSRGAAQAQKGDIFAGVGNGLVKRFSPSGALLDTLDTGTSSQYMTGLCLDGAMNLFATSHSLDRISKFDAQGNLVASSFASGLARPESCARDAGGSLYVSQIGGGIRKIGPTGATLASFDVGRADWLDLASDQCTLLFTTEGTTVSRFDVCAAEAKPDFATDLPGPCFALRIRGNGEVLVACGGSAVRLDSAGKLLHRYIATNFDPPTGSLLPLTLDPDGTTFWTGDYATGQVYRIDIGSGAQIATWNAAPISLLDGLLAVGSPPKKGDVNGDGFVDVADIFGLINYIFARGAPVIPPAIGDVNGDGFVDISDVFYLINYVFAVGPPPVG